MHSELTGYIYTINIYNIYIYIQNSLKLVDNLYIYIYKRANGMYIFIYPKQFEACGQFVPVFKLLQGHIYYAKYYGRGKGG